MGEPMAVRTGYPRQSPNTRPRRGEGEPRRERTLRITPWAIATPYRYLLATANAGGGWERVSAPVVAGKEAAPSNGCA